MKKALIFWGGWDGHEPDKVAKVFGDTLINNGFSVDISDTLDCLNDVDALKSLDLIVPIWTMGKIEDHQVNAVIEAVASGVGIAGCHGGMCDSFRESVTWQFMTGGQWVSHPGNDQVDYVVNIKNSSSPLIEGISDFTLKSEQYYLHVDPVIEVLATTRFPIVDGPHCSNKSVDMPVVWTKRWGKGKVFYTSLGHHADVFNIPQALEIMKRGLLWASKKEGAL